MVLKNLISQIKSLVMLSSLLAVLIASGCSCSSDEHETQKETTPEKTEFTDRHGGSSKYRNSEYPKRQTIQITFNGHEVFINNRRFHDPVSAAEYALQLGKESQNEIVIDYATSRAKTVADLERALDARNLIYRRGGRS